MTDQLLDILKFALLALLYLFFARVLWAVWSEVRGPRAGHMVMTQVELVDTTTAAPAPVEPYRAKRPKRGLVTKLVVLQPRERKGATFMVNGEVRIGRSPACAISIPDDTFVSGTHARLYQFDGITWVEDLNSTNGSHLNGNRLSTPQAMTKGDRLQIGSTIWEAH
jgi:predicted component of type VI protein secretion system